MLAPNKGQLKRRAVSSPPHSDLVGHKPPDRRSGRLPALPYPPLEHSKLPSTIACTTPLLPKSGFDRTSAFANYKLSGFADSPSAFANYVCPVLIAPRHKTLNNMFGSDILETAIGLFLIFLLFSAVCSAVNEWIVGHLFKWRAELLEQAIIKMLGDKGLKDDFYKLPLIQSLCDKNENKPSYLSVSRFVDALLALIRNRAANASPPLPVSLEDLAKDPKKILEALKTSGNTDLLKLIESLISGAPDMATARKQLEGWLAAVVTVIFNVDTFTITRVTMQDSKLRATLVAAAEETAKQPANTSTNGAASIDDVEKRIKGLGLPIGWPTGADISNDNPQWFMSGTLALRTGETWWMKIWGFVVTIVALSLGAPFWFDMLNKVVNLRAAGKKPEEKAKEKKEKDK